MVVTLELSASMEFLVKAELTVVAAVGRFVRALRDECKPMHSTSTALKADSTCSLKLSSTFLMCCVEASSLSAKALSSVLSVWTRCASDGSHQGGATIGPRGAIRGAAGVAQAATQQLSLQDRRQRKSLRSRGGCVLC